ncbi:hypothetical protein ACQY0O_004373 [Thecaphora frezii]
MSVSPAAQAAVSNEPASDSPRTAGDAPSNVAHTILRIKRKRGQDPVEALVIQQAEHRAKRRSNAHSLAQPRSASAALGGPQDHQLSAQEQDAASRPEPSRGVFRLAETVSIDSFSDPAAARLLHDRITALSRSKRGEQNPQTLPIARLPTAHTPSSVPSRSQRSSASPAPPSGIATDPLHRSLESLHGPRDAASASAPPSATVPDGADRDRERSIKQKSSVASSLRFKVVRKEPLGQLRHSGSTGSLRRKLKSAGVTGRPWQEARRPPQIRSKKEKDAEAVFGRIIDAVSQSNESRSRSGNKGKSKRKDAPQRADPEMEALDSRFAEMLGNYLKTRNLEPPADLEEFSTGRKRAHGPDSDSDPSEGDKEDSDDDYVYDIYYRDMLPSRTGPAGAAESGLEPAAVPGHERTFATRSSIPESMAMPRVQGGAVVPPEVAPAAAHFPGLDIASAETAMAQLEGFEDTDDELEAGDDGEGYESYDEGEDEDSNDEDFYRNDYPEEELPDDDDVDFGNYNDDSEGDDDEDPYGECTGARGQIAV